MNRLFRRMAAGRRVALVAPAAALLLALPAVAAPVVFGAGQAPRSSVTAPIAEAQATAGGLVVYGDTVRSAEGLPPEDAPTLACVRANRFPQGSGIVFRVRVVDPATGELLTNESGVSVVLTLPDGSTRPFRYGQHPPGPVAADFYWTAVFTVPDDYPTGSFNYQITATDSQGRMGEFIDFKVAPSQVQIVALGTR